MLKFPGDRQSFTSCIINHAKQAQQNQVPPKAVHAMEYDSDSAALPNEVEDICACISMVETSRIKLRRILSSKNLVH